MVLCHLAMILSAAVITFALHRKRVAKAWGRFKNGEFYIEANDQEK
jgi:hypothetical protein